MPEGGSGFLGFLQKKGVTVVAGICNYPGENLGEFLGRSKFAEKD
jgi:hypothetical protein